MDSRYVARKALIAAGWTLAEIGSLLGEPDQVEHWRYRRTAGVRHLYDRERVAKADRRRGVRIKLKVHGTPCVLSVARVDERVEIERDGESIELDGPAAEAIRAIMLIEHRPTAAHKAHLVTVIEHVLEGHE